MGKGTPPKSSVPGESGGNSAVIARSASCHTSSKRCFTSTKPLRIWVESLGGNTIHIDRKFRVYKGV